MKYALKQSTKNSDNTNSTVQHLTSSIYIGKQKSLEMLNFKNISPSADFYSKLDKLSKDLIIISGNVLYITHEIDKVKKIVTRMDLNQNLQKQVDEFFEESEETSPQTEPVEQK